MQFDKACRAKAKSVPTANRWAALNDDDDETPEITGTVAFCIASDDEDDTPELSLEDQSAIVKEFLDEIDKRSGVASCSCQTTISFPPHFEVLAGVCVAPAAKPGCTDRTTCGTRSVSASPEVQVDDKFGYQDYRGKNECE